MVFGSHHGLEPMQTFVTKGFEERKQLSTFGR
jgi:hypothetical protein